MSMATGSTGLENSLLRMRLDQAQGAPPVKGAVMTVRVMTADQERDTRQKVQNYIDATDKLAQTQKRVDESQRRIDESQKKIDQSQLKIDDAQKRNKQANLEVADAQKRRAEAEQKLVAAQNGIAAAKSGQMQARQMQQESQAKIAQHQANISALDTETIKNLDGMVGALLKLREMHIANSDNVAKIDALRSTIVQYRNNLPPDANSRKITMAQYRQQASELLQSLQGSKQVQKLTK